MLINLENEVIKLKRKDIGLTDLHIEKYKELKIAIFDAMNPGKLAEYMKTLQASIDDTEGQIVSLAKSIEGALANSMSAAIVGLVDGTKTVEQAFADMFASIGKAFIDMATKMLAEKLMLTVLKAFTSPTPQLPLNGHANGGRPEVGAVSLVGERGPELFVPDTAGTIIPNEVAFSDAYSAMSGEASNRTTSAFTEANEAMAMATSTRNANASAAAEQDAYNQAVEFLQSGRSTVTFDTVRVGELDVITREDAVKIGMDSAKLAEANIYRGMRNMPNSRRKAGIK